MGNCGIWVMITNIYGIRDFHYQSKHRMREEIRFAGQLKVLFWEEETNRFREQDVRFKLVMDLID